MSRFALFFSESQRSRMLKAIVAVMLCWFALEPALMSSEVRVSNADDELYVEGLNNFGTATDYRIFDYSIGRFYGGLKFYLWEHLLALESAVWLIFWRTLAYASVVISAAWFMARWFSHGGIAWVLMAILWGGLAFAYSYHAYLSPIFLVFGWSAGWVMAGLSLEPDSSRNRQFLVTVFFLGLIIHENNIGFAGIPFAVRWARYGWRAVPRMAELHTLLGILIITYLVFWWGLRVWTASYGLFPGNVYGGASVNFSWQIIPATAIYSLSGLPGLEAWLERASSTGLLVGPSEWWYRVVHGLKYWDFISALGVGGAVWWAGSRIKVTDSTGASISSHIRLGVVLVVWAFGSQVLLAATPKYQVWSHQRMWPYYQSLNATVVWQVLALLVFVVLVATVMPRLGRAGKVLILVISLLAAINTLAVKAMNRVIVMQFEQAPFYHHGH